jgi:hypothetical protein
MVVAHMDEKKSSRFSDKKNTPVTGYLYNIPCVWIVL